MCHVSGKVCTVKSNLKKTVMGINEMHICYFLKSRETCRSFLRSSSPGQASGNEDRQLSQTKCWVHQALVDSSSMGLACVFWSISYSIQIFSWNNTIRSCITLEQVWCVLFGHVLFQINYACEGISTLVLWHCVWEHQHGDLEDQVDGFWMTTASLSHDFLV